ncbi:hypothetical protein GE21DRAFT_9038 [Neurospora crassa]|uniref:Uncharacterized protein n=1 Tax=Neurospora crassa (strain ATCC 24698 / 74-OR23-1A / CBS 708.71 / DSM 1257 / FGSC 987) TaxID=367110 RepID=Q7S6U8_NEUCR|nr:hypothetical protein NCU05491 [Neurospora crassa OR74A]EAA31217.1 hypothetical protein NCU05491 [Neurospora crassa OR74A]KHE81624.1 hypothetical protein GE21DRAFT_9038 [Neurospora crassa]|eukprot:XP_960453.1 hypothetical protein NCU05491 [Neurospora crassa OR74A]
MSSQTAPQTTASQTASQNQTGSEAASQQTAGPPPPVSSSPALNILPSNQPAVNNAVSSPSLPSPHYLPASIAMKDSAGVDPGPGPTRHPRPLTAADLHLQLEKEQEAVVNRLSRELSMLRAAQNASVVSNASVISNASSASASVSGAESVPIGDAYVGSGAPGLSHHRVSMHNRTSSSASTRSLAANAGSISTSLTGISSPAPIRPTQPVPIGGISLSRQNSAASRRSQAGSPSSAHFMGSYSGALPMHSFTPSSNPGDPSTVNYFAHRLSGAFHSMAATPGSIPTSDHSPAILPGTPRYEETAFYRSELESVKRENEALKRRVRELERMVRERRASDASRASQGGAGSLAPRTRSDSTSTTASVSVTASTAATGGVSIAAPRDADPTARAERPRVVSAISSIAVGVPDDEVKVGESAASSGLGEHDKRRKHDKGPEAEGQAQA